MSLVEKALLKLQKLQETKPVQPKVARGALDATAYGIEPAAQRVQVEKRIVTLDQPALRAAGLLPQEKQRRRVTNEFRHIKRPLIMAALGKTEDALADGHLIMVSSALSGEGKTFISFNLALSIALEKDVRVLLVDADIAKPHISAALGLAKEKGLVDVLADPSLDVESLALPTDVAGLSVLPAGRGDETATELLASERMKAVMAELARNDTRRIVLFDSAPLLLTNESRALASVAGQVVLVVRANVTPRSVVNDALALLADNKAVALIFNQSAQTTMDGYYGYGYGTGSGDGSG